jgi:hypothetical protein
MENDNTYTDKSEDYSKNYNNQVFEKFKFKKKNGKRRNKSNKPQRGKELRFSY